LAACIGRLWGTDRCRILQCGECGFGFADPFVGGDEEFYALLHEQAGYPGWKWDFELAVPEIARFPGGGRALDIGAGTGYFLKSLPKQWGRYATEGSPATRAVLRDAGIEVFPDLTAVVADSGGFQVITLFQVLEHIAEFPGLLRRCRELISPEGRLIVTVPDGRAMIRQEQVTGCPDMPPNHVNKWGPESLGRALAAAGFLSEKTVPQPASWRKVSNLAYLRVLSDAADSRSLATRVYRIDSKTVRALLLRALGIPAVLRMLPQIRRWPWSGSFGVVARPA
jgi:hypothetical protein